jgi:hypothetical protein
MTPPDDVPRDGSRDDPQKGTPDGPVEPELPFDEEAAWRMIVENYGERAQLGGSSLDPDVAGPPMLPLDPRTSPPPDRVEPVAPPPPEVFDRSYLDALDADRPAARRDRRRTDDEEHFVPPDPPPVPKGTPARRLAWAGLFAPPLLMILAVVLGWTFPMWLSVLLIAAFVGGFVFLVVTMPRDGGDGWGDGAVV